MIPRVPSAPTNRRVISYPADVFLALIFIPAVSKTVPFARTTSRFRVFSFIVPYLTALVPLAPVEHIPQSDASAPAFIEVYK